MSAATRRPLVIEAAACFVRAMTGAGRSMRALSAPVPAVSLMLIAHLCGAAMICSIRFAAELHPARAD